MDDEYLDLVDDTDQIIGRALRAEVHRQGLHNFRGVSAFVRNSNGLLLVLRRHHSKDILPGSLDTSVTGHVRSGETYEKAFRREVAEELNLSLETIPWRILGDLWPHRHGNYSFLRCFEVTYNETPPYNRDDFTEHAWLTPAQLRERLERGEGALSAPYPLCCVILWSVIIRLQLPTATTD